MAADGAEVIASSPEELAKWLRDDLALGETREGFGRARIDCSSDKWIME